MTATVEERKAANKALIDEVLKAYPEKMATWTNSWRPPRRFRRSNTERLCR